MKPADLEQLEKLNNLRKEGAITDTEYEAQKQKYLNETTPKKKSSIKKRIITISLIVIGVLCIMNYRKIFKTTIQRPHPVLVSVTANDLSSKLLDYQMKVKGTVRNVGGDGSIVVKATVTQNADTWTKTKRLYLRAYDTKDFEITFNEVRLLKKTPKYSVTAFAQ